jgi:hypothetical protein
MHVRISVLARSYKSLGREEFGRPEKRGAWQKLNKLSRNRVKCDVTLK